MQKKNGPLLKGPLQLFIFPLLDHFALQQGVCGSGTLLAVLFGGAYKVHKKRVRVLHGAFQLGVVLRPDKERVVPNLHNFHQPGFGVFTTGSHASRLVLF